MYKNYDYKDFLDDTEKMLDFIYLDRQEFLQSYSYLTSLEYDLTHGKFYMNLEKNFVRLYEEILSFSNSEKQYYKKILNNFYNKLPKKQQENIIKELTKNNLYCNICM